MIKILFIGDVCGNAGVKTCEYVIDKLKSENNEFDFIIANGENAAGGVGITYPIAKQLYSAGVDAITLGNHTWSRKEILNFIDDDNKIVRPANFPKSSPGKGSAIISKENKKIGVINVAGCVYMEPNDCPFLASDDEITKLKQYTNVIIVDIHAEATSEKCALAYYLDGRVSAVVGTHTHVQTADERIFERGTGFISDAGMTGPYEGVIGVDKEIILEKFLTHMPQKFEVARGITQFNGVILEMNEDNGKCINIKRLQMFGK